MKFWIVIICIASLLVACSGEHEQTRKEIDEIASQDHQNSDEKVLESSFKCK